MKHVKVLFALLGVAILATSSFAFTSKSFHKFASTNYVFSTSVTPSSSTVVVSGNYTIISSPNCPLQRQRICDIVIDPVAHPEYVNPDGTLNFSNSTLATTVQAHYNVTTDEGLTFNDITFHYRSNP